MPETKDSGTMTENKAASNNDAIPPLKRKPGRPRKSDDSESVPLEPIAPAVVETTGDTAAAESAPVAEEKPAPKKRGRKPKSAIVADGPVAEKTRKKPGPKPGSKRKSKTVLLPVTDKPTPRVKPGPKPKTETVEATGNAAAAENAPKKRGPKPGSKRKPKEAAATVESPAVEKTRKKPGPKPGSKRKKTTEPEAAKPEVKSETRTERPAYSGSTYTPPPAKEATNPVVFFGKLVFKIAKKLLG